MLSWLVAPLLCCGALLVAATSFGLPWPGRLWPGGFGVAGQSTATTYYLSPSGNDANSGTSPGTAWRTLRRASTAALRPGDRLLLRGGARFAGELRLDRADAGSAARPLIVGSYGTRRATILGGPSGIVVTDTSGVVIRGLIITGRRGAMRAGGAAIDLFSNRRRGHRFSHVVITGIDASGFTYGIAIGALGPRGFRDVRVADSSLHGNLDAGLASFGPAFNPKAPAYAHTDLSVSGVRAFGNLGDSGQTRTATGSGITVSSVDGARVTGSTAFDNGGSGGTTDSGPIGIWAYDATHVVIERSLSYDNRSSNPHDGGGFGFDQNTSRSAMQFNLSYGNWGPGYLFFSRLNDGFFADNVMRYNISSGDARTSNRSGGILLTGRIAHCAVYQNSVVLGRWAGFPHAPLTIGKAVRAVTVRNSILVASRAGPLVLAKAALPRSHALLQGNDYYPAGRHWSVQWGPVSYSSIRAWRRATGQETLLHRATANVRPVGFTVNPKMTGPVLGLSVRSATAPGIGAGFMLRRGSPLIGAGLDLRHFGINPGRTDFSGQRVPLGRPSIGAQQR